MKSPSAVFNRKFAFVVLMIFSGVFSLVASAAPSSIDQAKRAKIDMTLRIAAEQINRGLYKQAQVQLDNLKASDEYAAYISERQHQKILTLKAQVSMSLQERDKIVRALQQSELLAEQGNYMDAATLLSQVKDSQYASEQERQMMQKSYLEISQKNRAEQQKWQALFDQSVASFNNGQTENARRGFMQVIASGYPVRGEKTAEQYVLLIDSGAASRAQSLEAPVLPAAADPQPQVASSRFDEEIEPIDLLEIEVDKQTADMASVQAQASGSRYVDEIIQKRTVQIDYTRAIVNDAIEKAGQSLTNEDFDQARQALRRAFSILEKNKMLLGDVIYSEYSAQLSNLEQKVNEADQTSQAKAEELRTIEADQLTQEIRKSMDDQRSQAVADYMDRAFAFQSEQRYDEALGQLEQLLAIDPQNQRALITKQTLQHTVNYIEQRSIKDKMDAEEIRSLLGVQRMSIPFSDEINFPSNWKEISERREAAMAEAESPADAAIHNLLDETVDLSMLTENTTLEEAIIILRNSVSPLLLPIVVYWNDLEENAFIERTAPIGIDGAGLNSVVVRDAMSRILEAVSSGGFAELDFVVQGGTVTIATVESLPANFVTEMYDVTDLL
ncbi:MAG: hypothetical protein ACYSOT_09305, partial [Planctomycetota bacterium]